MRKLFALAVIFTLVLAGCEDGDSNNTGSKTTLTIKNESTIKIDQVVFRSVTFIKENADIIGTWTGENIRNSIHTLRIDIADNAWTGSTNTGYGDGSTGQGKWTRKGNAFTLSNNGSGYLKNGTATLSGDTLTANFEDFYQNYSFELTSNNLDKSIKSGTSITKNVEAGPGYIFFKINSADYRTSELVVVDENEKFVFTFINSTLVVDVNNSNSAVTLGEQ